MLATNSPMRRFKRPLLGFALVLAAYVVAKDVILLLQAERDKVALLKYAVAGAYSVVLLLRESMLATDPSRSE